MRRGVILALIAVGFVTAMFLLGERPESSLASKQRVIIGFITPLSGSRASIGEDARAAAEMAWSEIQANNRERFSSIEIRFEDSQGDPAKGIAAFQKLAAEGAVAVVTQNSNVSLPISPVANRLNLVQLAITTTSDRFTTPSDFVFRANGTTLEEAKLMAKFLMEHQENELEKIGVAFMRDEYPEMLHQHLLRELQGKQLLEVTSEEFLPSETDFRTTLARLQDRGVRQVVCLGYQVQCGLFVKQLRELRIEPTLILMNTPVNNRDFFTTAREAADGVVVTYPMTDLESGPARKFFEAYGREMNFFSANAYDAIRILHSAVQECEARVSSHCLRQELGGLPPFDGASGLKHFDANGDMQDEYVLLVAREGRFIPVEPSGERP